MLFDSLPPSAFEPAWLTLALKILPWLLPLLVQPTVMRISGASPFFSAVSWLVTTAVVHALVDMPMFYLVANSVMAFVTYTMLLLLASGKEKAEAPPLTEDAIPPAPPERRQDDVHDPWEGGHR